MHLNPLIKKMLIHRRLRQQLNDSSYFDQRLFKADIEGSQAYARALVRSDILTEKEGRQIESGLSEVLAEFAKQQSFGLERSS